MKRKTTKPKPADYEVLIHEVSLDDGLDGSVLTVTISRHFTDAVEADKHFRSWLAAMKGQGPMTVELNRELLDLLDAVARGPGRTIRAVSLCGDGVKR